MLIQKNSCNRKAVSGEQRGDMGALKSQCRWMENRAAAS